MSGTTPSPDGTSPPAVLAHDWFPGRVPPNVVLRPGAHLDTSYGFALFLSERPAALTMGTASGAYDMTTFAVGPSGRVSVGDYACLNSTSFFCERRISVGAHCLLAWGVVLSDTWAHAPVPARRAAMLRSALSSGRPLPSLPEAAPVTLQENVWVGFDSVILPGVTLGRGCVIGCKSLVATDIPPYAVAAGNPARVIRFLAPDDTAEARAQALREYTHGV